MGDPECQTLLPMLKSDIIDILVSCVNQKLAETKIEWKKKQSLCVVLCSKGYPDNYEKNIKIKNFEKLVLNENNLLFHAGTKKVENEIFAIGGRVLNFIALSDNLSNARKNIHQNLKNLDWDKGFYRKDIAFKIINK